MNKVRETKLAVAIWKSTGVAHAAMAAPLSMKMRYRAATVREWLKQSAGPTPP